MDHRHVKLPLLVRLKALHQTIHNEDEFTVQFVFFMIGFVAFSFFMACSIPSFMTNIVAQWVITLIFTLLFSTIMIGLVLLIGHVLQENIDPWWNKILSQYRKDIEPLQKAEMEKVDDILLKDK